MSDSPPVLYSFRRCPFAMRARLALAASGVRCTLREVVLRDKPAALLAASPKGTVPVLVTPQGVIEQSLDIMQWALARSDPGGWLAPQAESAAAMHGLIAECDGEFKRHLDRYKYPERYPGEDPLAHREAAIDFLGNLEQRLATRAFLFGARPALADGAIAPFVRQFAHTDPAWFATLSLPGVQRWLEEFLASPLFAAVMHKYPRWQPGDAGEGFPPLDPDAPGGMPIA